MPRPDEPLEDFMLWTQVPERRPQRIDWASAAIWGSAGLLCLAFWGAVAWGIITGVM